MKITLKIEGMTSACCAEEVEESLLKVKGVKKASVDFRKGMAKIEFEAGKVSTDQLIEAIKEAGFETSIIKEGVEEERFKTELKGLSEKYGIPLKKLKEHWDFVKEESAKIFSKCCKWSHSQGITEMIDAEAFCQSAIAEGMGEYSMAEQLFKLKKLKKLTDAEIKALVKDRYGKFALKYAGKGNPCPIRKKQVKGLYSEEELSFVPKTALNLALGCGNPVSFANLKSGEVVVDFGCGAGIDLILASHRVGPKGRVIGVDIAPQMIEKAKQSEAEAGFPAKRIEERVGDIEKLELPDSFADVVISNCVIILTPNKEPAYREAFRILKPGGRLAISDMVFSEKIDPEIKERFQSNWAGVVGGAIYEKDYLEIVKRAGFSQIEIVKRHFLTPEELFAMSTCPGREFVPAPDEKDLQAVQGKVVSIKFRAIKP